MNKAPRPHRSDGAPASGGLGFNPLLLLVTVAILLTMCAVTLCPSFAQTQTEEKPPQAKSTPRPPPQQPSLKLSASRASVSSCPDEQKSAQVQLTASGFDVKGVSTQYDWNVSGGRILGEGASVTWVLSGVEAGTYSAAVTAQTPQTAVAPGYSATAKTQVIVERCKADVPSCPKMSVTCPRMIRAGERLIAKGAWQGGTAGVKPTYAWRATAGRIVSGQGTPEIVLDTTGADGQLIALRLDLRGYSVGCATSCRTLVQAAVTVTPTPTPTPSVSPSASTSASPFVTPATSSDVSPPPSPILPVTPGGQSPQRLWLWILLAALATLGIGALLAKLFRPKLLSSMWVAIVMGKVRKVSDEVHCTVFAPEQVAPGDSFLVQVFAHLAEQAGQLAALAAKADDAARERGSKALSQPIERETKITFTLDMPGLKVVEPQKPPSLIWRGAVDYVQFAVDVPEDCKSQKISGVVKIYYGDEKAPVGQLMFTLKVAEAGAARPAAASAPVTPPQKEIRYKHAFISYCSKDRRKVLQGLQGLRKGWKWAGITDFIDLQGIESGEYWREVIQLNLDRCDLFVLFWSSAAQCSEEVSKEINYALARKGGRAENPPAFEPFTIELPLPQPLPVGLESLHFGDELLYFITAEEAIEAKRAGDGQN